MKRPLRIRFDNGVERSAIAEVYRMSDYAEVRLSWEEGGETTCLTLTPEEALSIGCDLIHEARSARERP
jgi:hypothetical protein